MKSHTLLALTLALASCGGGNSTTGPSAPPQAQLSLLVTVHRYGITNNQGLNQHAADIAVRESGGVAANFNFVRMEGDPSRSVEIGPAAIERKGISSTVPAHSQIAFSMALYCNHVTRVTADLTDANGYHHSMTWTP